ncbi:MAG: lamin tail domain-containing protein, partial [Verrucomicrobiales bacterium]|nr:lamin tail domain-containing protein [Verrucomicrobiales bacterium]
MCALLTWLLLCACADPSCADENLIISEVMALNRRTLPDRDGEYPDWIEIFNPNSGSVNLEGWYLTDDPKVLKKWRLPASKIKGNGYLVVFASQKDR